MGDPLALAPAVLLPVYFSVALSQALGSYPGECGAGAAVPQEAQDGNSTIMLLPACSFSGRKDVTWGSLVRKAW